LYGKPRPSEIGVGFLEGYIVNNMPFVTPNDMGGMAWPCGGSGFRSRHVFAITIKSDASIEPREPEAKLRNQDSALNTKDGGMIGMVAMTAIGKGSYDVRKFESRYNNTVPEVLKPRAGKVLLEPSVDDPSVRGLTACFMSFILREHPLISLCCPACHSCCVLAIGSRA
jgi:hypothetical protein